MVIKLDIRDRKILMELDTDATKPLSTIAKKLGISKEAVAYRIKQLEEKEIIVNYITLSHFAKTGMIHFKVYIQYSRINKEQTTKIIDYLKSFPNIGWLANSEGTFDLMFSIRFKEIYLFEDFKDEFCTKFDKQFQSIQIAILTEAETKPRAYILPEDKNYLHTTFLHCDKAKEEILNEEDWKVLHAISTNARKSANELSKDTKLTERIIRYRRKELERRGIIVGYKLAINYRKLGYLFFKCFVSFRNMDAQSYKQLRMYVHSHPNIIYWIKTIGSWDAELEIETPTAEEFYAFVTEFKEKFGLIIHHIDTSLISKEHTIAHA